MPSDSIPSSPPQTPYTCDTLPAPQNLRLSRALSPTPQLALDDPQPSAANFDVSAIDTAGALAATTPDKMDLVPDASVIEPRETTPAPSQPPARKLCVRHQRMANEQTNLKLQQSLDALPVHEREGINNIWSSFSSSSHPHRALILQGMLTMCCFSQLSFLTEELKHLIRIDPLFILPREVSLQILSYLDAISLCRAAQVSKLWRNLADDDVLWRSICEQHIGTKCRKCGWGLPVLERRRGPCAASPTPSTSSGLKRDLEEDSAYLGEDRRPTKRAKSATTQLAELHLSSSQSASDFLVPSTSAVPSPSIPQYSSSLVEAPASYSVPITITRPWKDIYCERLGIERNWRRGQCTVRTFTGHQDGVMCMQFSETLKHPLFPVLITGSYDRTVRVWNMETGQEVRCLRGHTRAVRALQFDEAKLVTGSMDRTIKVWNWRTGTCLRTLEGHTEGVVAVSFDDDVLASGSADMTVKVWNFKTGQAFTLRGHRDWVNSVQLWDANKADSCDSGPTGLTPATGAVSVSAGTSFDIEPGKMLFSGSDDGTVRLWDLNLRSCVRIFQGHVGQVQSIKLITVDENDSRLDPEPSHGTANGATVVSPSPSQPSTPPPTASPPPQDPHSPLPSGLPGFAPASVSIPAGTPPGHPGTHSPSAAAPPGFDPYAYRNSPHAPVASRSYVHPPDSPSTTAVTTAAPTSTTSRRSPTPPTSSTITTTTSRKKKTVLLSGSLDNTIKVWDIDTGETIRSLFGHIEGVWAIASDRFRLVSGSHDRTIKVWVWEEGRCMATLVGHRGAVTCIALGDDKIVSGSDDGDVRIWNFTP